MKINMNDFSRFLSELNQGDFEVDDWLESAGVEQEVMGRIGANASSALVENVLGVDHEEVLKGLDGDPEGETFLHVVSMKFTPELFEQFLGKAQSLAYNIACSSFRLGWEAHREFKGERDG